jgi:hypothetical protein
VASQEGLSSVEFSSVQFSSVVIQVKIFQRTIVDTDKTRFLSGFPHEVIIQLWFYVLKEAGKLASS